VKLSTAFVLIPALFLTAWIAIANRRPVPVSFDPFSQATPALVIENVPLYWVFLAGALAGLVLGASGAWLAQGRHRRAAREAKRALKTMEKENGTTLPTVRR
jgi:hypothetical protein